MPVNTANLCVNQSGKRASGEKSGNSEHGARLFHVIRLSECKGVAIYFFRLLKVYLRHWLWFLAYTANVGIPLAKAVCRASALRKPRFI